MKKALTLVIVFMVSASLLFVIAPQSYGQDFGLTEDLRVNSYSYYTSPGTGAFMIVGEVQNIGTQYFHDARLRAVLYNSSGEFLAESDISIIYADQLAPDETAPFYMYFTAASSVTGDLSWVTTGFSRIEFVSFGAADDTPQDFGLHIGGHNAATDASGNYVVSGIVLNRGTYYPEKSFVVASFYNSTGGVVAIGISNYLTRYLAPNDYSQFSFSLFDAISGTSSKIANYTVRVVTDGELAESAPTPSSTSAPTSSPGTTPNPTSTSSAAPTNDNNTESSNTLYIALAAVGIAIAVVVLVLLLKRR